MGLSINKGKTKIMRMNTNRGEPITLEVEYFSYLGSIITKEGGTDADISSRIGKAFVQLNIWRSKEVQQQTKV